MSCNMQMNIYLQHIEEYLEKQCFRYDDEPQQDLFEAMRYSLLAGGKRLRPVFVLIFAKCAAVTGRLRHLLLRQSRWSTPTV